jgi:hypothetical protein
MDSQSLEQEENMARNFKSFTNYTVAEGMNAQLGQNGAIIIDGTAEIAGPFVAVMGLEDSVVDTSECDVTWLSGTVPATFKIPAGGTIYGRFASIELDSGSVIAYYG